MAVTKEQLASLLSEYRKRYRVPFVVEVLGTPNAGKTSAIQTYEKVLSRSGIRHKIIYEAASHCKIKNKLSPEFNLWTMSDTIKQLLEVQDSNYDLVICERGIFDTLCWLHLYYQDKLISKSEYDKLTNYLLLSRFVKSINCCYIMRCDVDASINRENLSGLLEITGTIINKTVLAKYNMALEAGKRLYGSSFQRIMTLDTSNLNQATINRTFVSAIINYLKELSLNYSALQISEKVVSNE